MIKQMIVWMNKKLGMWKDGGSSKSAGTLSERSANWTAAAGVTKGSETKRSQSLNLQKRWQQLEGKEKKKEVGKKD